MRLLLSSGSADRHAPRPVLAGVQINVGPDQLDRDFSGRVLSRFAPRGTYDLAELIESLPADQRPDVTACSIDGHSSSWPVNLAACRGVRLLMIGDIFATGEGPGSVLDYLRREPFDRVVMVGSDADRALILSATEAPLHWWPGLLCPVTDRLAALVRRAERQSFIACAPPHPRRYSGLNLSLAALHRAQLPPTYWPRDHQERMEFFGHSEFVVLPGEHGEWSPEWFEALAAGALILGSAPQLWSADVPDGRVSSPEELADRIEYFRKNPSFAEALRTSAAARYDANLSEEKRRAGLDALAYGPDERLPEFARCSSRETALHLDPMALRRALPLASALEGLLARKPAAIATIETGTSREVRWIAGRFPRLKIRAEAGTGASCEFVGTISPNGLQGEFKRAEILWAPLIDLQTALATGFTRNDPAIPLFQRSGVVTVEQQLLTAQEQLERGVHEEAWRLCQPLLSQPAGFADALIIAADAAVEMAQEARWVELRNVLRRLDEFDARLRHLETRHALRVGLHAKRLVERGWTRWEDGDNAAALALAEQVLVKQPCMPAALRLRACALQRMNAADKATAAWEDVLRYAPNLHQTRVDWGLLLWQQGRRSEATEQFKRALTQCPHDPDCAVICEGLASQVGELQVTAGPERDLLITMPETNRRHGSGVLLRRFFSHSEDFVTLRSFTNYQGVEEFGGINLLLSGQGLNAAERTTRLRRLLEPFRIRRILCVPFSPADFQHASMVQDFTGAPLCTYVMDDQNLTVSKVADADAGALFAASRLRLTISPEMQVGYAAKYPGRFDLMPPIVTDVSVRRNNRWNPKQRAANHVVLVGNVWSDGQLKQLAKFIFRAGLRVDWFGREAHPVLAKAGLHGQGFLPEPELADRLKTYPYVIVPSGMLDGTEDNEWLTRLSLPSRMVFLLQTQTPMLVLGSPSTAAGCFVEKLSLGVVLPYAANDPRRALRALTQTTTRAWFLEQAARHADNFVMPAAGTWIWNSLAAGRALPAPFDAAYAPAEMTEPELAHVMAV